MANYAVIGLLCASLVVILCFWAKLRMAVKSCKAAGYFTYGNFSLFASRMLNIAVKMLILIFSLLYSARLVQVYGEQYFDNSLPFMSYRLDG